MLVLHLSEYLSLLLLTYQTQSQRTFAFNDDFIKTTTTCFDRSQPTSTVRGYHVYTYIPGATPNTVKLDLNGIPPFAFSYKDDEDRCWCYI
jgi:hypothetical protein